MTVLYFLLLALQCFLSNVDGAGSSQNCGMRRTTLCSPEIKKFCLLQELVQNKDVVFTVLNNASVHVNPETTTYDVHVYELCEGYESIANLDFPRVLQGGHQCVDRPIHTNFVEFYKNCSQHLPIDRNDFTLLAFSSDGEGCHPEYHFVFVISMPPLTDDCSTCQGSLQRCVRTSNTTCSFECVCDSGFNPVAGPQGLVCEDINECHNTSLCSGEHRHCKNLVGNFACDCDDGFVDRGDVCVEINECNATPQLCGEFSECTSFTGGYSCVCLPGFSGIGRNCTDIDECLMEGVCGQNEVCENTNGSYICSCKEGFQNITGEGCTDINECLDRSLCMGENLHCKNLEGNYTCECDDGYMLEGNACMDINECLDRSVCMGENLHCKNLEGNYTCECDDGYMLEGNVCMDINECLDRSLCMGENLHCKNLEGNYTCECDDGYMLEGNVCMDINECLDRSLCMGENLYCKNLEGNYTCKCDDGYMLEGNACTDVDECSIGTHCGNHSKCTNTRGGHICTCSTGFTLNRDGHCEDVNECSLEGACLEYEDCANTLGSFTCSCSHGYTGSVGNCTDINECLEYPCGPNEDCTNTNGAYSCQCSPGYKSTGDNTCIDIDECAGMNVSCRGHGDCRNINGSFSCVCDEGYKVSENQSCEDVNECAEEGICGAHSECVNTDGSHNCSCLDGFLPYNGSCISSDPCRQEEAEAPRCPGNFEECQADPDDFLKFECQCIPGYKRDNEECIIDRDKLYEEANDFLTHKLTLDNIEEALDLLRKLSAVPIDPSDSKELSVLAGILNRITNFLANVAGNYTISDTIGIVELMNNILTPTNISVDERDVALSLIHSMESYGKFLVNIIGSNNRFERNMENILVLSEEVAINGESYQFPSSRFSGNDLLTKASIKLPKEVLMERSHDGVVQITTIIIDNVDMFFLPNDTDYQPLSVVLSSHVGRSSSSSKGNEASKLTTLLSHPVEMVFILNQNMSEMPDAKFDCVFLNLTTNNWSRDGVDMVVAEDGRVTCRSHHLTSFALLLNIRGNVDIANSKALQIITKIGLSISLICLAMTIIFFISHGKQLFQQVHYFVHLNLCISLFLAYIVFLFQDFAVGHQIPCTVIAVVLNYLFLAVFCWMLCEGVMLYLMLVVVFSTLSKKWWFFMLLGWGPPLLLAGLTYGIFHKNYVIEDFKACWLASGNGHYTILMFAIPAAIIIALNTIFLVMVGRSLFKNLKGGKNKKKKQHSLVSNQTKALVILLPLIGLTWVFGFIFVDNREVILTSGIISAILNSLQGLFIFVFHVLRSNKVMGRVEKKLGLRSTTKSRYSTTNQSQSSSMPVGERYGAKMSIQMNAVPVIRPSPPAEDVESGIGIEEKSSGSSYQSPSPPMSPSSQTPPPQTQTELQLHTPSPQPQTPPPQPQTPPPQPQTPPPQPQTPPPQPQTPLPQTPPPQPQTPSPQPETPPPQPQTSLSQSQTLPQQPQTPPPRPQPPPSQSPTPPPQPSTPSKLASSSRTDISRSLTPSPQMPRSLFPLAPPLHHITPPPTLQRSLTLPTSPTKASKVKTVKIVDKESSEEPQDCKPQVNYFRGNWSFKKK